MNNFKEKAIKFLENRGLKTHESKIVFGTAVAVLVLFISPLFFRGVIELMKSSASTSDAFLTELLNERDTQVMLQKAKSAGLKVESYVYDYGESNVIKDPSTGEILLEQRIEELGEHVSISPSLVGQALLRLGFPITCDASTGARIHIRRNGKEINGINKSLKVTLKRPDGMSDSDFNKLKDAVREAINRVNNALDNVDTSRVVPRLTEAFNEQNLSEGVNLNPTNIPGSGQYGETDYRQIRNGVNQTIIDLNMAKVTNANIGNVLGHELGHAYGLDHSNTLGNIMREGSQWTKADFDGTNFLKFSENQIRALIAGYDPSKKLDLYNCTGDLGDGNLSVGGQSSGGSSYVVQRPMYAMPVFIVCYPPSTGKGCSTPIPVGGPSTVGPDPINELVTGTEAYLDACRSAVLMVSDPDNPTGPKLPIVKSFAGYSISFGTITETQKTQYPCWKQLAPDTVLNFTNPVPPLPTEVDPNYYTNHPEIKFASPDTILDPSDILKLLFGQAPKINNVYVSDFKTITDAQSISVYPIDPSGFQNIEKVNAIINLQGENADSYRGYFSWKRDSAPYSNGKNPISCTGGGFAAVNPDPKYGPEYVTLETCNANSSSGYVFFGFKVRSDFNTPFTGHVVSGSASNNLGSFGYTASRTWDLVDKTPPVVSYTSGYLRTDYDFYKYKGSFDLQVNASDNKGVSSVDFQVDGVSVGISTTTIYTNIYTGYVYKITFDSTKVPNGVRNLTAVATDTAGNKSTSPVVKIGVLNDSTKPTVSITSPTNDAKVSGTINIDGIASDDESVFSVQFYFDGKALWSRDATSPYSVSLDTTKYPDGVHILTADAIDQLINRGTSTPVTITINNVVSPTPAPTPVPPPTPTPVPTPVPPPTPTPDTTPPTISITAPVNNATVSNLSSFPVAVDVSDNIGIASVQYKIDGKPVSIEITIPQFASYSVSLGNTANILNGIHTLVAVAKDTSGNRATSSPITFTMKNVPSLNTPTTGSTVSGSSVTVSATAFTNINGIQFQLDGVNLGSEDTVSPYSVVWDTTTATNATHSLTAIARSVLEDKWPSSPVAVTVNNITPDTTAPIISITSPTGGSTVSGSAVTISANATDNIGVVGVQFRLDGANIGAEDVTSPYEATWNSTTVTNGSHTLTAVARDSAGNTKTSTAVSVTVNNVVSDTTVPTVSITSPTNGSTITGVSTIAVTASDNVAVSSVQLKVDGVNSGSPVTTGTIVQKEKQSLLASIINFFIAQASTQTKTFSISLNTTTLTSGTHTLTVVATDSSGNTATSAGVSVTVNNVVADTTLPTVSITAPTAGLTISGSSFTVSANATDNIGVTGVQFKLDGVNLGVEDTTSPYSTILNSTTVTNGTHTITAVARDTSGNITTSASVNITVNNIVPDTTSPTVSITAPVVTATSLSGTSVTVSANATDNIGVVGVQFKVDGVNIGTEDTTSPYSITWNSTTVVNAVHVLTAVARDAAGNTKISAGVNVAVNNASVNLAPSGTAYRWSKNSSATSNSNRVAATGLNDNNLTTDVSLNGGTGEASALYEAGGVVWSTAQSIKSVKFINGTWVSSGDGGFGANLKLQTTTDGITWVDSGWTISPSYSYNSSSVSGVTYTFSGSAASVRGVRISGQVRNTTNSSYWANMREVQAF